MKLSFDTADKINKLAFKGYQSKKSETGEDIYEFNIPHDSKKYDAYLEIFPVSENEDKNFQIAEKPLKSRRTGVSQFLLDTKGTKINLRNFRLPDDSPFAYRYILKPKRAEYGSTQIVTEAGTVISDSENNKYNLVTRNGSRGSKTGAMYLAIPDTFAGWTYSDDGKVVEDKNSAEKAKLVKKNYSNKIGGNLAGLEKHIDKLKEQGYTRIVTTPLFTDDSLSAHGYWIKNAMQMSQSLGNINNYASFTKKLFSNGMNLVADGAFVNEGLEGVHFRDVLKRGEDSPYYQWFRAEGLKGGPLSLAVFSRNKEFIDHKVINSPYEYTQPGGIEILVGKNKDYNPHKPTYVQIFDKRAGLQDLYDTNTHEDIIINYTFEINPETYNRNVEQLNEYNKINTVPINLGSYKAARFLTANDNSVLEEKFEGRFETWDANNDIPKLNFAFSKSDLKVLKKISNDERDSKLSELAETNYEVQDYAIASGKYWTKKTNDILLEFVAQELKGIDEDPKAVYNKIKQNKNLPDSVKNDLSPEIIENVIKGNYKLNNSNKSKDYNDSLLKGLMDLPLDAIEFGDDIVAVLAYPYLTNRAHDKNDLGKSRFELFLEGNQNIKPEYSEIYNKTTGFYKDELFALADKVMKKVGSKLSSGNKLFEETAVTEFGSYVLPLVGQDIAKFAIIKSLLPQSEFKVNENGEISYDYKKLKQSSLNEVGILSTSAKNDAEKLVAKLESGVNKISEEDINKIADSIYKRIRHTGELQFKMAEMIIDRSQSGLDWRIDAAKDIADIDSIRNSDSEFEIIWQNVIDFWKSFTQNTLKENPNTYIAAEITDAGDIYKISGKPSRFRNFADPANNFAELKFLQETGINTTANYSIYSELSQLLSKPFEGGQSHSDFVRNKKIYEILSSGYLNANQLDSIISSYTFAGNHDKPRILHCLAIDMELFNSKFKSENDRKIAADILNKDVSSINFSKVSPAAVAMADAVRGAFGKALDKVFDDKDTRDVIFKKISLAVADLAEGKYLNNKFSPDAFGVKPFDQTMDAVLKQAKDKYGLDISEKEKEQLFNTTFDILLKPAMQKLETIMGFLVSLPGNPTLFAGDELGLTGYETKCKNVYLQNRAFVNWDLLNDSNKKYLKEFNERINSIIALRANPRLEPLNNGAPYSLPYHADKSGRKAQGQALPVSGVLRQGSNGDLVISLFNPSGFGVDYHYGKGYEEISLDRIKLKPEIENGHQKAGLSGGITPGTILYNINENDKTTYKVESNGVDYFIQRYDGDKKIDTVLNHGTMSASNLILTSISPKGQTSFKGKKVLYNPQYNFVSSPYAKKEKLAVGTILQSNV